MTKEALAKMLLFTIILLVSIIGTIFNNRLDALPQKYTVGQIIEIAKPIKGGLQAIYKYSINGNEYSNSVNIGTFDSVAKVGARFIVSIPINYWSSGVMLFLKKLKHP